MTKLSPAAQAVINAFAKASDGEYIDGEWHQDDIGQLAAAFRAAADQVAPLWDAPSWDCELVMGNWQESDRIRRALFAIATELEGQP